MKIGELTFIIPQGNLNVRLADVELTLEELKELAKTISDLVNPPPPRDFGKVSQSE